MKLTSLFALSALTAISHAASVPTRQPLDLGNFRFPSSESINATDVSKRSLVTRGVDTAGIRCTSKGPTLRQEQRLFVGDCLVSPNGDLKLVLQNDGNIVLYLMLIDAYTGVALWSTGTNGKPINFLIMQGDGNLVAYDKNSKPYWDSKTTRKGATGRVLWVQDDWNIVIYESNESTSVRASGTGGGSDVKSFEGHSRAAFNGVFSVRTKTDWTAALWSYANYIDPSEHIFNKEGIDMSNYKDVNQLTGKYAATTSQQVGYGMPASVS